jgi:predicted transcriptional regulator of viral defense system
MKILELNKINKLYFGYEEISRVLSITLSSARVSASRYVHQGLLVKLKRNIYILKEKWNVLETEEKFTLANLVQVPSYISLMTALDYYEITTQIQRDFIESVAVKRTMEKEVDDTVFNFTKIHAGLYSGFKKDKDFFIATPEKAFLDAFYLMSLGRYNFDIDSIDFGKFNRNEIMTMGKKFPAKTKKLLNKNGYFRKT